MVICKAIWALEINLVPINCVMNISIANFATQSACENTIFMNFRVTNLVGGKPRLEIKKE